MNAYQIATTLHRTVFAQVADHLPDEHDATKRYVAAELEAAVGRLADVAATGQEMNYISLETRLTEAVTSLWLSRPLSTGDPRIPRPRALARGILLALKDQAELIQGGTK